MTDLINRSDAIRAVNEKLDSIDHVPQWVFDQLTDALTKVPSQEPAPKKMKRPYAFDITSIDTYMMAYSLGKVMAGTWTWRTLVEMLAIGVMMMMATFPFQVEDECDERE